MSFGPAPGKCAARLRNAGTGALAVLVLCSVGARPALAQVVNCPVSVSAQFKQIAPVKSDGAQAAITDFEAAFVANAQVRLVGAHIAVVHGGGASFSEVLHPDELVYRPGRPMRWTLWDGRPPEPTEEVLVHCEYEGGLVLYRSLGSKIHQCTLTSALLPSGAKPAKAGAKGATKGKPRPSPEPSAPALPQAREILAKGNFSCR
jgi:hypothetical protein